jgi:hypothetical protein
VPYPVHILVAAKRLSPRCVCWLQVERLLPLCECVYTIKRFVETRSRIDHPKVAQVSMQLLYGQCWLEVTTGSECVMHCAAKCFMVACMVPSKACWESLQAVKKAISAASS